MRLPSNPENKVHPFVGCILGFVFAIISAIAIFLTGHHDYRFCFGIGLFEPCLIGFFWGLIALVEYSDILCKKIFNNNKK